MRREQLPCLSLWGRDKRERKTERRKRRRRKKKKKALAISKEPVKFYSVWELCGRESKKEGLVVLGEGSYEDTKYKFVQMRTEKVKIFCLTQYQICILPITATIYIYTIPSLSDTVRTVMSHTLLTTYKILSHLFLFLD